MDGLKKSLLQVLVAIDQLANAILGGMADETLSARAYRMKAKGQKYWGWTASAINLLFFWQRRPDHCERAYLAEVHRRQFPKDYAFVHRQSAIIDTDEAP